MLLTLQIPDSPPIFPVTLEDGFIQRRRKLCPRSQRFTRIQDTLENSPNLLLRDFMRIYLGLSFPWIYVDWMKQFINHKVGVHIKSTISISYHHHHQHHHHQNHYHHHHHHTERWGSKSNLPVASPRFRIPSPGFHSFCWNTFPVQKISHFNGEFDFFGIVIPPMENRPNYFFASIEKNTLPVERWNMITITEMTTRLPRMMTH